MRKLFCTGLSIAVLFAITLFLGGCGLTDPDRNDEEYITDLISNSGLFGSLEIIEGSVGFNGSLGFSINAPIPESLGFQRDYETHRRDISIEIVGRHAEATVEHELSGIFTIVAPDSSYIKEIVLDSGERKAKFEQSDGGGPWNGWRITDLSVLQGHSEDFFPNILSIRIQSASVDLMFYPGTDILYTPDVLTFTPSEEVYIEVTLATPANYVILHHLQTDISVWSHKLLDLQSEDAPYVFANTYVSPAEPGEYNNFIDVLSAETIEETDSPYRAAAGGMPYVVE